LCFHVIEHVYNLNIFSKIYSLLENDGHVVIEVPNKSGHRFIGNDKNEEHIFIFNLLSLVLLAEKNNFVVIESSFGNYESPSYPDCLRVCLQKKKHYFQYRKFPKILNPLVRKKVIIYGAGGDFHKYVLPHIKKISVKGFFFTKKSPQNLPINNGTVFSPPELKKLTDHFILICSLKYEEEMKKNLELIEWPNKRIYTLSKLLNSLN